MARRCVNVFKVGMTPEEICNCYRDGLTAGGVTEGHDQEMVAQARTAFGLGEKDLVLGQHKVGLFHCSYYSLNIQHFFHRYF
jgi:chitin synthase